MSRMPQRNDKVIDQLGKVERKGLVVGSTYVQDELFIKVLFEGQKAWEQPDELEYSSYFTKENCGWGRWDKDTQTWMIEKSGDELPEDDPINVAFQESIHKFNIDLLLKRIGSDTELNIIHIDVLAIEYRKNADECGTYNVYKPHYEGKAKDYEDYRYYRIHGKLPE